ncbi:hypothetical protein [Ramlibacter sp.]|uniref:hypothetical protein n=1 Tax=Ramlibacter sp. TaxID=1917967 RepID=UPI002D564643|nr:hypothetical protein [Ramlibacter sp.]HYD75754.1 hypothetical protein [Ramlibacter sp.]
MTVEEMHKAKQEAENQIRDALDGFMRQTGLLVEDVRVGWQDFQPVCQPHRVRSVGSVTLDVRLA